MSKFGVGALRSTCLAAAMAVGGMAVADWDPAAVEAREQATREALADFADADPSMQRFFEEAHGYAVFPSVGAGALIIGGAHGKGEVFEQDRYIGNAKITEISIGLSAGGKNFRQIIFFRSKEVLDEFKENKFEFGAKASAVAAQKGAAAGTVWNDDIAVFTMGDSGLMDGNGDWKWGQIYFTCPTGDKCLSLVGK